MNNHRIVSAEDAGNIDRYAMDIEGYSGFNLMKKAGNAIADLSYVLCQKYSFSHCQIFCGKGNNGGDGYVAARVLHLKGIHTEVFMTTHPETLTGDAAEHWKEMKKSGISPIIIEEAEELPPYIKTKAVWIDAILGTGLRNDVRGKIRKILHILVKNHTDQPVVAVDIPSGIDGTNGRCLGPVLKADLTAVMGFYKWGNFLNEGKFYGGDKILIDLGYSPKSLNQTELTVELCSDERVRTLIKPVRATDHKYSRGQMVCIGGQVDMPGAPALACMAGLRSGAGMVRTISPSQTCKLIYSQNPEIICHPVKKEYICESDMSLWHTLSAKTSAVLIGPGLGRRAETKSFVETFLSHETVPAVLDADALHLVNPDLIRQASSPLILTPHEGEFLSLTGIKKELLSRDPVKAVHKCAMKLKQIIHLKSSTSLTALPDGRIYIHPQGSPGMATAGSGDVLGGIICSLLCQGHSPESAVLTGAFIHGKAGEKAAELKGIRGMIATDIIYCLPEVLKSYEYLQP